MEIDGNYDKCDYSACTAMLMLCKKRKVVKCHQICNHREVKRENNQTNKKTLHTSCHLMSKTSTATVNHNTDLSHLFNSHLACIELIENLIHYLYFSIVVTSPQCAKLSHLSHVSNKIMPSLTDK